MKWSVALIVAGVLPAVVAAQSGTMAKGDKMDKMEMKDATYTGCVESGGAAGMFLLTHFTADHMGKDTMKKDAMKSDAMKKDTMAKDTMSKDAMAPTTLTLSSTSVDLSRHVGHKVSITGSGAHGKMDTMGKDTMTKDAPAFTVKSLKMVAASCS
jgi:pentapeptide MXKDX repeat protein